MSLKKKSFENIVGTENAGNQNICLSLSQFLPVSRQISDFCLHLLWLLLMFERRNVAFYVFSSINLFPNDKF